MNDFDSKELKPDLSDRPVKNQRSGVSIPKVSRQHVMIGVGVIILIILIVAVSSGLKGKTAAEVGQEGQSITLTPTQPSSGLSPDASGNMPTAQGTSSQPLDVQPNAISGSSILDTPTQPQVIPTPAQNRVEIPGEVVDALASKNDTSNATVPVTPAQETSTTSAGASTATINTAANSSNTNSSNTNGTSANSLATLRSLPAGNVTLQLSSASRADSLQAFATKHKLSNYWIYETQRNGSPWFVLIIGSYANAAEAGKAVAALPSEVQAQKPWVKPIRQVQQDIKK